jgi:hypothetical protein
VKCRQHGDAVRPGASLCALADAPAGSAGSFSASMLRVARWRWGRAWRSTPNTRNGGSR